MPETFTLRGYPAVVSDVTGASFRLFWRDRSGQLMAAIFFVMVVASAFIGWSASHTVAAVYQHAQDIAQQRHIAIPEHLLPTPSALSTLRNMTSYVLLLGALTAIILGFQCVTLERRSGMLALLRSRPVHPGAFALGKITALGTLFALIVLATAIINALTILAIPQVHFQSGDAMALIRFYAESWLFLYFFAILSAGLTAAQRDEALGLLTTLSIWLVLTFVIPQLTDNIQPTAAINPITAMQPAPDSLFFHVTGALLGGLSIVDLYRTTATALLGFAPEGSVSGSLMPQVLWLVLADVAVTVIATHSIRNLAIHSGGDHA